MLKYIDIHTHIIPDVDDGSPDLETSILLIEGEIKQGVGAIICTPHYRRGMFESDKEKILINFELLKQEVKKRNLDVELYLGQEIYIRSYDSLKKLLDKDKVIFINNKKYILLEFSYTNEIDISEIVYDAKLKGYIPIIAHIERYDYIKLDDIADIIEAGGLIQVNAASVLGKYGFKIKQFVKKLLKHDLVDYIASDIHCDRINYMHDCYVYICKKYSEELANKLFFTNAMKLIEGKNE